MTAQELVPPLFCGSLGTSYIETTGICQQRCRIILKKIIRLYPGSESLHGELSNA